MKKPICVPFAVVGFRQGHLNDRGARGAVGSQVFLSYSRNDLAAAALLRAELERAGLPVFKDDESVREGDLWLDKLQTAVDACDAFVVLVGRDGVRRWIGAETQVALSRYFGPHHDALRLPIFPILLDETKPEALPAFLRLFQAAVWTGREPLPDRLIKQIRARTIAADERAVFEGCPFVGLAAYRIDQAHMFFGRQKETLDALACFDRRPGLPTVRWLEVNGNSGSGKSSLMQAGLLPLVDQGWLWPRTGYERWTRIGPMMPGEHPTVMLAEALSRGLGPDMGEVVENLSRGDDQLRYWLRGRKQEDSAFLLAIDQFEELLTFADADERRRFDRLLAAALEDADCPLFVISTVRSDFLDRFGEDLPQLVAVRNRMGRPWTLAPIGAEGLRETIDGPARLAGLDVSEVREAMVREAEDEPGALPLVENALFWLWEKRTGGRLSGKLLSEHGGIAGILTRCADDLLADLEPRQRDRALELLFRMVLIDSEGRHHARRRIPLVEAIAVAGGGGRGRILVDHLAGRRSPEAGQDHGPLRLITITEDVGDGATAARQDRWVNLIHETLIRSKGLGTAGKPQPYWPTLWTYIETNKERAARRERLQLMAREWKDRKGFSRLFGLADWSLLFGLRGLAAPGGLEHRYLRWSQARAATEAVILLAILGVVGESAFWMITRKVPFDVLAERWSYILGKDLPLPELIEVPAGSFMMGSKRDDGSKPVHRVAFAAPYRIAKTEVTFEQWDACVSSGDCGGYRPADQDWGRGTRPAINVSWYDSQGYAAWLGRKLRAECRLPSEAEWEYAAGALTTAEYALPAPNGSDDIAGKGLANCGDCGSGWSGRSTAPVGPFRPNSWHLYDMHGNVWEWVEDCWHDSYEGAPEDEKPWRDEGDGNCLTRVLRGGSWDYDQDYARTAFRNRSDPVNRNNNVGFRVICSFRSSAQ